MLEDYLRFAQHLPDVVIKVEGKQDEFRARNRLVEAALEHNCEYLFFLDDDQSIGWDGDYTLLHKMLAAMTLDMGVMGALVYRRTGACEPVAYREVDGGYVTIPDPGPGLHDVDSVGGGAMLVRMSMMDGDRWFTRESPYGSDMQMCRRARAKGLRVVLNADCVVGHYQADPVLVTPRNRTLIWALDAPKPTATEAAIAHALSQNRGTVGLQYGPGRVADLMDIRVDVVPQGRPVKGRYDWALVTEPTTSARLADVVQALKPKGGLFVPWAGSEKVRRFLAKTTRQITEGVYAKEIP